ncbi:MAG TPA: sigma-70 family RNA polymerase sigma factor [Anaerolineae bacterium]|nr:sigma-70 family RNA polymerase sigma factor [Anaerolineae bacterium]
MYKDIDEDNLVELAKVDVDAFGEIYLRYYDRMYNYVYYRTSNHNDAEDIVERVFERAFKHIGRYENKGYPFSAWLYRIARNLVANWHRDNSRRTILSLDDITRWQVDPRDPPDIATELLEHRELLLEAIQRLPADRQELLILKFVEHESNANIGQIMGRSEGAIKSLYHRTLRALRDEVDELLKPEKPLSWWPLGRGRKR